MPDFDKIQLNVERDGKNIFGVVYIPRGDNGTKRYPTIIYSHGMSSNHESGDKYAAEFARRGYVVYCFDFCGGYESKSDGDPLKMTVFSEQADLDAVFHHIARLPYVDANNIFLMGASQGGAVTSLVASQEAGLIKGLILLYPAFNLPEEIRAAFPDPLKFTDIYELAVPVGRPYLEELYGFDFYNVIANYRGPVLILHGSADAAVPSGYSVKAVRTYPHASLELIGGGKHGFEGGIFKYAVKVIVNFLDEETDLADESGMNGDLNVPSGMGGFGGMGGMGGIPRPGMGL